MEVCNGNTWSIACAEAFGPNEARIICRQLEFNSTHVNYFIVPVLSNVGIVLLQRIIPTFDEFSGCLGIEENLSECRGQTEGAEDRRKRGLQLGELGELSCSQQAGVQCGGNRLNRGGGGGGFESYTYY